MLIPLWSKLTSFLKDKKLSSHSAVENQGFFACRWKGPDNKKITDPRRSKKSTEPTDPEHWNQKKTGRKPKNIQDNMFHKKANDSLRIPRYHLDPHLSSRTKADSRHPDKENDHLETKKLFLPNYTYLKSCFTQCSGSGMFIPDPGSDFFPSWIPDPNFLHPGSRILKEFKYFNPKKAKKWC